MSAFTLLCGCAGCMGQRPHDQTTSTSGSVATIAKQSFDSVQAAGQIARGGSNWLAIGDGAANSIGPVQLSYSFLATMQQATYADPQSAQSYGMSAFSTTAGFAAFDQQQIQATELALSLWADVANVRFTRDTGTSGYSDTGEIRFGGLAGGSGYAFAFLPTADIGGGATEASGDVWFNLHETSLRNFGTGGYGFATVLHEIGHALGLRHPGNYNGTATYAADAVYREDTRQYTLMSYFDASATGAQHMGVNATSPLLHDIAAIQAIYGANMTTRTGNTTYGFNATADRDIFRLSSAAEKAVFAVWDAGGDDTFDFSGYAVRQNINLTSESFSSVGGLVDNVAIARGVTIEHAIGGTSDDTILGNDTDNRLNGLDGFDSLMGGLGRDTLVGGTGDDSLMGGEGNDSLDGGNDADSVDGGTGHDVLDGGQGIDTLMGGDGRDTIFGGSEGDRLFGWVGEDLMYGEDGDDRLFGEGDDDSLHGGDGRDSLVGGDGNDLLGGGSGNDTLDGGAGMDLADYAAAISRIRVSLLVTTAQNTLGSGFDLLRDIENVAGSAFGDTITGSRTDNVLWGDAGSDLIDGHDGHDVIWAGLGADTVLGGADDDLVMGEDGNDLLFGWTGEDTLDGGQGDDILVAEDGNDTALGGEGSDTVWSGMNDDLIEGGTGNDWLFGETGNDLILGGDDADLLFGWFGADTLLGGNGDDILLGEQDDDTLEGGAGRDVLFGGGGRDMLDGGADADIIVALDGDDMLIGGLGADTLYGYFGSDTLDGGAGDDLLRGEQDADLLIGGAGRDTFLFARSDVSQGVTDRISDFMAFGEADTIAFQGIQSREVWLSQSGADTIINISVAGGTAGIVVAGSTIATVEANLFFM